MRAHLVMLLLAGLPALLKALPAELPAETPTAVRRLEDDHDHDHSEDDGHDHDEKKTEKSNDPCFPSSAKLTRADGAVVSVASLKEGDSIVAVTAEGQLTTDTVSLLSLAKPDASATFVGLTTESSSLRLTENHRVPFGEACCSMLKKAKDIEVGDAIWAVADGAKTPTMQMVTAKSTSVLQGLHSPVLTHGGFPVVDGVVTAFDDIETVTLAKHTLKYLLPLCKAFNSCNLFRRTFLAADRQYIDEA